MSTHDEGEFRIGESIIMTVQKPSLADAITDIVDRLSTARQNVADLENELREAKQKLMGAVGRQRKAVKPVANGAKRGRPRKVQATEQAGEAA